jgi:hypothetical protein
LNPSTTSLARNSIDDESSRRITTCGDSPNSVSPDESSQLADELEHDEMRNAATTGSTKLSFLDPKLNDVMGLKTMSLIRPKSCG